MRLLGRCFAAWFVSGFVVACDGPRDVYIDLRTDYRGGLDYTLVQVRQGAEVLSLTRAFASDQPLAAFRVARLRTDEFRTPADFVIELVDDAGRPIAGRTIRIARRPDRTSALTVLITRSCAAVTCPQAEPEGTECLVGRCVEPGCLDPAQCVTPECARDADCPAIAGDCVRPRCLEGACIATADDTRCEAPTVCSVATARCVAPLRAADAAVPVAIDAGAADAGPSFQVQCERRQYAGRAYLFCLDAGVVRARAQALCIREGMQLVRLDDAEEEGWVASVLAQRSVLDAHVDGSDAATEGEWRFADGSLFWRGAADGVAQGFYVRWALDEPNQYPTPANCAFVWASPSGPLGWHDNACDNHLAPVICEQRASD